MKKLQRPVGLSDSKRRIAQLAAALNDLGIPPGGDFYVISPEQLREEVAGDRVGPSSVDSPTSKYAALNNTPRSGTQRARVLAAIGTAPRTRDELAHSLGLPDSSVDARVWELTRGGHICGTGKTRTTDAGQQAVVLGLTEKGRAALAEVQAA